MRHAPQSRKPGSTGDWPWQPVQSLPMKALVIVVRGLHLGYLGCYGNDWIDTPTLDCLAAEGIVLDGHFADCPDAEGAAHAWRRGQYHFPQVAGNAQPPSLETPDLFALLRGAGIHTLLMTESPQSTELALAAEWDAVLPFSARAIGEQLAARERCLLWVELATLLPPWDMPEEFLLRYCEEEPETESEPLEPLPDPALGLLDPRDEATFLRLQRTFAGAVAYLDDVLGQLFERLRKANQLDSLLVMVTSDGGMPLGEHGVVGRCRPWLHDELLHLPLLVRLPEAVQAGRRVPALTQPVDLPLTLLDAFGLPLPASHGHTLLPLLHGRTEQVRPYACAGLQVGEAVEWALRTPQWSFLLPIAAGTDEPMRGPQLYAKPEDRWEINNVAQHQMELVEHMQKVLGAFVGATRQPGPLVPPALRDVEAEPVLDSAGTPTPGEREA